MKDLAWALMGHGEYAEAAHVFGKALFVSRNVFGREDSDSLDLANNLAVALEKDGKYDGAEPILRDNMLIWGKKAGPRAPQTVGAIANLADVLVNLGRYGEAEKLSGDAISFSRENLKSAETSRERIRESIKEWNKKLKGGAQVFEADPGGAEINQINQIMLASMNSLALALQGQGQYDEAEPVAREIVERSGQVFGPRDSHTLTSMNNLGLVLARQGDNEAAERVDRETLRLRREILGPKHPDTLTSLTSLAKDLVNEGHNAEAEALFREALQLQREVLGNRHPKTLETLGNLAVVLDKQTRYSDAEVLYREALDGQRDVLGPTHPYTLTSELNFVACLSAQGKQDGWCNRASAPDGTESAVLGRYGDVHNSPSARTPPTCYFSLGLPEHASEFGKFTKRRRGCKRVGFVGAATVQKPCG
jgi:tetratricopeptide (TPR) repeat protein